MRRVPDFGRLDTRRNKARACEGQTLSDMEAVLSSSQVCFPCKAATKSEAPLAYNLLNWR